MSEVAFNLKALGISTSPVQGESNPKSLQGRSSTTKALSADPALASWYEQAYAYYQAVSSGQEPAPDAAAWNEFLNQMNWAYEQLHGSSWTGSDWGDIQPWDPEGDNFGYSQGGAPSDPYGGVPGTQGNWVHTGESADLGFTGDAVRDVWSNEINLNITSLSADVQAVKVMDESFQPPEEVLKLIITDKATGKQDVIRVHDFQDAKVNVFSSTQEQIKDDTGLLNWEKLSSTPDVDLSEYTNAAVEQTEDGHYVAELPYGQTIDFTPPYNTADTEDETWELWGNFNLNLRPTDQVTVYEGSKLDPDGFTVVIERRNGKKITLQIPKGFKGNFNMNPENIRWVPKGNGNPVVHPDFPLEVATDGVTADPGHPVTPSDPAEDLEIPEEFADFFTVNGQGNNSGGDAVAEGDAPTQTENGNRVWDGKDFDIYTRKDGKESEVLASGNVTLHASSNREYWLVKYKNGQYIIEVYEDVPMKNGKPDFTESEVKETFKVDGDILDELKLDIEDSRVWFGEGLGDPDGFDGVSPDPDASMPGSKKITLGEGDPSSTPEVDWPSLDIQSNLARFDGKGGQYGRQLAIQIAAAIKTGNWSAVSSLLITLQGDPKYANDGVRAFIDSLYRSVGSDAEKFGEVMDLIPEDVRLQLINTVTAQQDELNESGAAQWNSATTAEQIIATLDGEANS